MRTPAERGKRERILEVAESSLGEHGYHGTRLHDIARRVGIQKASLFHYFPSKEQLYRAVVNAGFVETEQTIRKVLEAEGPPLQKIRALVAAYVDMVAAHPERTKILLRQSLGDAPEDYQMANAERLLHTVAAFVTEAQGAKTRARVDPLALVLSVMGMVAFFFTSVPVLAPAWLGDPWSAASIERVKRHVLDVVERCLAAGSEAADAGALLTTDASLAHAP